MSQFEDLDSMEIAQQVIKSLRSQRSTQRSLLEQPNDLRVRDLNRIIAQEKLVRVKYLEDKDNVDKLLVASLIQPVADLSIQSSSKVPQDDHSDDSSDEEFGKSMSSYVSQKSSTKSKITNLRDKIVDCRKNDSSLLEKDDFSDLEGSDDEKELQEIFHDFVPSNSKNNNFSKTNSSTTVSKGLDLKKSQNFDVVNSSLQKGIVIKPGQAIKIKSMGGRTKKK